MNLWADPEVSPSPTPTPSDSNQPSAENTSSQALSDTKSKPQKKSPQKASWSAQIIRTAPENSRIQNLQIAETKIPVTLMPNNDIMRPLVEIQGHYQRRGWNLFYQNESVLGNFADKTEFKLFAYLNAHTSRISLVAKGPNGQMEKEQIVIFAPDAQEFRISARWGEALVSLGAASLTYHQTGYGDFSSKTGLVSITYNTPKWDSRYGLYADIKATLLTLSSNANSGPQVITGKLDGTYLLPPSTKHKVRTTLVFGGTYMTMVSNGSPFGFANLIAPEFGARGYYPTNSDSGWVGDIRYAPLGALTGIAEYGIDLSIGWTTRFSNYHRFEINLFYSDYAFQADPLTKSQTQLLSLRIGYTI